MTIFSNIQHPLTFAFGILGNITSFMVFLAPAPTFYRIVKRKSTEGFQSIPYVVALFSSMIWIYYAMLKTDATLLITVNAIGCVIETLYIAIFIAYSAKNIKIQTTKLVASLNFVAFWVIALSTHYLAEGRTQARILGWICLVTSVSVFAAPLCIMKKVIRTKSVEFMPFGLSFFLALSAVMWFFYGLLQKDFYVALPNIIGFVFGVVQMVLYLIYKNYKLKNIERENKLPTSIPTHYTHPVYDDHKHDVDQKSSTKDQTAASKGSKEGDIEARSVDEPAAVICTTLPVDVNINADMICESSMASCSTMTNQMKSIEVPNQVYLIENAA